MQANTGKEKARKNPFLTDRFASDVDVRSIYFFKTLLHVIENRAVRSWTREERLTSPCYSLSHKAANIPKAVSRIFGNNRRAMKYRKLWNYIFGHRHSFDEWRTALGDSASVRGQPLSNEHFLPIKLADAIFRAGKRPSFIFELLYF